MYKNYRAFYGGATPAMSKVAQMGSAAQDQQKTLLRNKLAENAQRILETKSFENEKVSKWLKDRQEAAKLSQQEVLDASGFEKTNILSQAKDTKFNAEPASYGVTASMGDANFSYARNKNVDKVTKTDPPIDGLQKGVRYNIITGNLQSWY